MDQKRLLELAGVQISESPYDIRANMLKEYKEKAEESVFELIKLEVMLRKDGHEKSSKDIDKAITHARAAKEAIIKAMENFEE